MRNSAVPAAGRLLLTAVFAAAGGGIFSLLSFPLPWMLGAMAAVLAGRSAGLALDAPPQPLRNAALISIGIAFGWRFSPETLMQVGPYLFPYLIATALMIASSIGLGLLFSAWTKTDRVSGVFGFIPGGLTEMVITGESVGAKPGTVVFLQTFRLLAVLAVVPFAVTTAFAGGGGAAAPSALLESAPRPETVFAWLWYLLPVAAAWALRNVVPAAYMLVTMIGTAVLHIAGVPLFPMPESAVLASQAVVGAGLGHSIRLNELRAAGKEWKRVGALVAVMLAASAVMGAALHLLTGMDLPTALLSIAPGGLIEMALTAASVGADPVVVTSLQFVRVYTILLTVPFLLKRWFRGAGEKQAV